MGYRSHPSGLKVLVVDDHLISREFTIAALRDVTAVVKQARSADEALRTALSDPPDAIFMDFQLAGESGPDVIGRLLASWPAAAPLPRVFILSAEPVSRDQLGASGAPVEAVLRKPVSPARLRELLVSGPRAAAPSGERPLADSRLRDLFRRELRARLFELDHHLFTGRPGDAAAILHQLIASSGLCGEHTLESKMRAMLAECRAGATTAGLARGYYSVWAAAACYLDSGGQIRTV